MSETTTTTSTTTSTSSSTTTSTTTAAPMTVTWGEVLALSNQIFENSVYGPTSARITYSIDNFESGATVYWRLQSAGIFPADDDDLLFATGSVVTASGEIEVTAKKDTNVEKTSQSFRVVFYQDSSFLLPLQANNQSPVIEIIDTDFDETSVNKVRIVASGSNFLYAPIITFSDPQLSTGILARAVAVVASPPGPSGASSGGTFVITQVNIINAGSGYLSPPSIYVGALGARSFTINTTYQSGTLLVFAGRYYLVTSGGQTSTTGPTHLSGTVVNGTCSLEYIADPEGGGEGAILAADLVPSVVFGPPKQAQQNLAYGNEQFDTGFRLFVDMNNQRFTSQFTPTHIVELTEPLYIGDSNIFVTDGSVLGEPDVDILRPGIIHINGERIIYYEKEGNRLGRLRRGVGGTGVPQVHLARSDVEDVGPNRYSDGDYYYPLVEYMAYPNRDVVPEGSSVVFTIETKNIDPGQLLYWTNTGSSSLVDFEGYNDTYFNYGSVITSGNWETAKANVTLRPRLDISTEGNETIIFNVHKDNRFTPPVATALTVTIADLSIIPEYYIVPRQVNVYEGQSIIFDITTRGIPGNTTLYWTNSGTSQASDFVVQINSGSVLIGGGYQEGYATLSIDTIKFPGIQGTKTFVAQLRTGSTSGPQVQTADVVYILNEADASFALKANTYLVDEGNTVRFDFMTANYPPNQTFYWFNTGTTTSLDLNPSQLSGSMTTTGTFFSGCASIIITPINDITTEGTETISISVYSGEPFDSTTKVAGPETVVVQDTSITPSATCIVDKPSVMEGDNFTFSITTSGIEVGRKLYYTNTGTATSADFVGYPGVSELTVTGSYRVGAASLTLTTLEDLSPETDFTPGGAEEGPETYIFNVYLENPATNPGALTLFSPITVTIVDTSRETTTTTTQPQVTEPPPGLVLDKFYNGDFEIDTPFVRPSPNGIDTMPGWKIYNPGVGDVPAQLRMNGFSQILGCDTPDDPTVYGENAPRGGNGSAPNPPDPVKWPYGDEPTVAGTWMWQVIDTSVNVDLAVPGFPGKKIIQLNSNGGTAAGYGIMRGPYLVSANAINVVAGDRVVFHYKAVQVADWYSVFAYLVEESSCRTIILLDETGADKPWTRIDRTIVAGEEGTYKFVFVNGSYDYSGGQALGANMYLDNIDKIPIVQPTTQPPVVPADTWALVTVIIDNTVNYTIHFDYVCPLAAIGVEVYLHISDDFSKAYAGPPGIFGDLIKAFTPDTTTGRVTFETVGKPPALYGFIGLVCPHATGDPFPYYVTRVFTLNGP